jgi:hypothetical protein
VGDVHRNEGGDASMTSDERGGGMTSRSGRATILENEDASGRVPGRTSGHASNYDGGGHRRLLYYGEREGLGGFDAWVKKETEGKGVVWLRWRGPAVETDPSTVEAGGAGRWTT